MGSRTCCLLLCKDKDTHLETYCTTKNHTISIIVCLFEICGHKLWFAISRSSKLRQHCSESSVDLILKRTMQTYYEKKKYLFVMTSGTSSRIVTWMRFSMRAPNSPLKTMTSKTSSQYWLSVSFHVSS